MYKIEKINLKNKRKNILISVCLIFLVSFIVLAYYIIKQSNAAPIFTGVTEIISDKNVDINYEQGISVIDGFGKKIDFTIDSSKVNIRKAGTYYAIYTAEDARKNITSEKRKIIINHDEQDTEREFYNFFNRNLVNKDILEVVEQIRNLIAYSHDSGENDPIWFGLKNGKGNCYVHAIMVKKALDLMKIENQLIHTLDKTHYWNLVKIENVWRHFDATPGKHIIGPAIDKEKIESEAMQGRKWDVSKWPKAE